MKPLIFAGAILGAVLPAMAQTNVSISVGQPGFYGRIDIGDFAPPPVVYAQPLIVERPVRVAPPVVYLRVPPGHQKHWSKFCGRYHACGQRVYFVRDDWYLNDYAPRYREMHARDEGRGHERGHEGRSHGHKDHGPGHGKGHGHGHDR